MPYRKHLTDSEELEQDMDYVRKSNRSRVRSRRMDYDEAEDSGSRRERYRGFNQRRRK